MNKSNFITLLSFVLLIAVVFLYSFAWKTPFEIPDTEVNDNSTQSEEQPTSSDINVPEVEFVEETNPVTEENPEETGDAEETDTPEDTETEAPVVANVSMDDALFIGDSRTVGIKEYAQIEGADFFADVGMSVYNIHDTYVSVPDVGNVTLSNLLSSKNYGKIYVMLGVNEVGYVFDNTVAKYGELIDFIREKQPDAVIFIQASLHVTTSRSARDDVINNEAINKLSAAQSQFANGKDILYIDANVIFDDEYGGLSSDMTGDDVHLYAKHYIEWGEWIIQQTAALIG